MVVILALSLFGRRQENSDLFILITSIINIFAAIILFLAYDGIFICATIALTIFLYIDIALIINSIINIVNKNKNDIVEDKKGETLIDEL